MKNNYEQIKEEIIEVNYYMMKSIQEGDELLVSMYKEKLNDLIDWALIAKKNEKAIIGK